jgi:hypothetical protein
MPGLRLLASMHSLRCRTPRILRHRLGMAAEPWATELAAAVDGRPGCSPPAVDAGTPTTIEPSRHIAKVAQLLSVLAEIWATITDYTALSRCVRNIGGHVRKISLLRGAADAAGGCRRGHGVSTAR